MTAPVLLVHHAANRGKPYHPASLRGLRACLEAKARIVELDIIPLADGDFALIHDQLLEKATDGEGYVALSTADQVRRQCPAGCSANGRSGPSFALHPAGHCY